MVDQEKLNSLENRVAALERLTKEEIEELKRQNQEFRMAYRLLYEQIHGPR